MSKIGRRPISIPDQITLKNEGGKMIVTGPLGSLSLEVPSQIEVTIENGEALVSRKSEDKLSKSLHGTIRALLANAIEGVSKGFEKQLEIVGVGYRASVEADKLTLKVGFSHEVEMPVPEGLTAEVKKNIIIIKGNDKQEVGQFAAEIRAVKKPEPYKGKGIKYVGERINRKVGKAVKSAGTGA